MLQVYRLGLNLPYIGLVMTVICLKTTGEKMINDFSKIELLSWLDIFKMGFGKILGLALNWV